MSFVVQRGFSKKMSSSQNDSETEYSKLTKIELEQRTRELESTIRSITEQLETRRARPGEQEKFDVWKIRALDKRNYVLSDLEQVKKVLANRGSIETAPSDDASISILREHNTMLTQRVRELELTVVSLRRELAETRGCVVR